MNALEADNLVFSYPDGTRALDGLSVSVAELESVGIIGANGAGKSTFVNHINGWFLPQSGSVTVCGIRLVRAALEQIRRIAGIVFQNPDDQLFMPRLLDDVAFGPRNLGIGEREVQERSEKALRDLGLWELRERPPAHLSHGQKRFAAFATVLVMAPRIIIMDEPTSDLDPRNRRSLIELVRSLSATKITVSHDLDFIWDTCSRVCVMDRGKIVANGPVREILSNASMLERHGLELPLRLQHL